MGVHCTMYTVYLTVNTVIILCKAATIEELRGQCDGLSSWKAITVNQTDVDGEGGGMNLYLCDSGFTVVLCEDHILIVSLHERATP